MTKEISTVWLFLCSVYRATWALWSGGIVTAILAFYRWRRKKALSWTWFVTPIAAAVLVASFVAWRDLYHKTLDQDAQVTRLEEERTSAERDSNEWEAKVGSLRDQNADLVARLAEKSRSQKMQVTAIVPKEPAPTIWWSQRPLEVPEAEEGKRYGAEITIRSDRQLDQAEFGWRCTAPIVTQECKAGTLYWHNIERNEISLRLMSPALSPRHTWVFILYAETPIRVSDFRWVGSSPVPTIVQQ
jgi:hypothetical protein